MSIMKKPVLLVVSFGTSFADALEKNITAIEKALAEAFPEYEVRRAFTSGMILKKLRARDGIHIDSVSEAMERLVRDGVQQVVVQPTHVMNGGEYDKMVEIVRAYVDRFQSLKIGRALLSDDHDMEAMIETVFAADAAMVPPDTALVYMGHGTDHEANLVALFEFETADGALLRSSFAIPQQGVGAVIADQSVFRFSETLVEGNGHVLRQLLDETDGVLHCWQSCEHADRVERQTGGRGPCHRDR